jgi:phenylalanyl-tRNA synthetase alpha chain
LKWLLCRGTWRDADFKAYNFNALGQPTYGGHLHPLLKVNITTTCQAIASALQLFAKKKETTHLPTYRPSYIQVRTQIRKAFTSMGFEEMPTNNYVESRYVAYLQFTWRLLATLPTRSECTG